MWPFLGEEKNERKVWDKGGEKQAGFIPYRQGLRN